MKFARGELRALLGIGCLAFSSCASDEVLLRWARTRGAIENGAFVSAIAMARQLCAEAPAELVGHLLLAQALRRSEEFSAAETALENATRLAPQHPQLLWQRSLLENLRGRHAAALQALDAIDTADAQATYHYQRGVALAALDHEDEALAAYARAAQLDGQFFAAHYAHYLGLRRMDAAAAQRSLEIVMRLQRELPDWIRNDQLRLEAGELSRIEWPGVVEFEHDPAAGDSIFVQLEAREVQGAMLEVWTESGWTRRRYDRAPTAVSLGQDRQVAVLRIVWPHGNTQNLFDIDAGALPQRLLVVREEFFLKGSWGGVQVREP